MDCLTFTSQIVESIAWPVSAIILAAMFKSQIGDLLKRIVKGKIPGGEFEFSDVAKGQLATADELIAPPQSDYDSSGTGIAESHNLDSAYEQLETLPRAAVIEGWRQLNAAAIECVREFYETSSGSSGIASSEEYSPRHIPPARLASYLRSNNVLTPDQIALFDELRRLRNQAMHSDRFDLDERKAKEYLILTELLLEKLNRYSLPSNE